MELINILEKVYHQAIKESSPAYAWQYGVALVLTLCAIITPKIWPTMRNVVTLVHEYGHAIIGILFGRKLSGIKLHEDTSGVTETAGTKTFFGLLSIIPTLLAGYTFPGFVGALLLYTSSQGYPRAVLSLCFLALFFILPFIRNLHGLGIITTTLLSLGLLVYFAPNIMLQGTVTTTGMFLVGGGFMSILELAQHHYQGRGEGSDAHQLGFGNKYLAKVWVGFFIVYGAASIAVSMLMIAFQLGFNP